MTKPAITSHGPMVCRQGSATLSKPKITTKATAVTAKADNTAFMEPSRWRWDAIHQSLAETMGKVRENGGLNQFPPWKIGVLMGFVANVW